jgi:hypothetical protein
MFLSDELSCTVTSDDMTHVTRYGEGPGFSHRRSPYLPSIGGPPLALSFQRSTRNFVTWRSDVVVFAMAINAGHDEISDVDVQNIGDELSGSVARGTDELRTIPKMSTARIEARATPTRVTLKERLSRSRTPDLREKT